MKEDNKLCTSCISCGICIGMCPYEAYGEEFSLKGRLITLDRIYAEEIDKNILPIFLLNCIECKNAETICPLNLSFDDIIEDILSHRRLKESIKNFLSNVTSSISIYIDYDNSDDIILINNLYSGLSNSLAINLHKLFNKKTEKKISLAFFSYPLHISNKFKDILPYNIEELLEKLLVKYNNVYVADDYTYTYLSEISSNVFAILDLILEYLNTGKIIISRELDLNAYITLPIINKVYNKVHKKYFLILSYVPKLMIKGTLKVMDIPIIDYMESYHYWKHRLSKYYNQLIDELINNEIDIIISNSMWIYDTFKLILNKKPIAQGFLSKLIFKLST